MKIIDDFLWKDDHKFFVDLFEHKDFPWYICKKVAAQEVPEEYESLRRRYFEELVQE